MPVVHTMQSSMGPRTQHHALTQALRVAGVWHTPRGTNTFVPQAAAIRHLNMHVHGHSHGGCLRVAARAQHSLSPTRTHTKINQHCLCAAKQPGRGPTAKLEHVLWDLADQRSMVDTHDRHKAASAAVLPTSSLPEMLPQQSDRLPHMANMARWLLLRKWAWHTLLCMAPELSLVCTPVHADTCQRTVRSRALVNARTTPRRTSLVHGCHCCCWYSSCSQPAPLLAISAPKDNTGKTGDRCQQRSLSQLLAGMPCHPYFLKHMETPYFCWSFNHHPRGLTQRNTCPPMPC